MSAEPATNLSVNACKRKQQHDFLSSEEPTLKKRKLFEEEIQKTAASFRSRRNCRQPQRYRPEDFAEDEKDLDDDTFGDDVVDMKVLEAEEDKYLQELEELEKEENADGETVIVTNNDIIHQEEEEAAKQFEEDEKLEDIIEDINDDDDEDDEELDKFVLESLDNDEEETNNTKDASETDGGNDTDIIPNSPTATTVTVMSQNPVETVETLVVPAPGLQSDVPAPVPEEP